MKNYLYHFPDFDDTPLMSNWQGKSTWDDTSWKNDICPSFTSDDLIQGYIVRVFSEYADEEKREDADMGQFYVGLYNADDDLIETLMVTDNMFDVEALIKRFEYANQVKKL